MAIYLLANGPMQTTAQFATVTTGTAIKTMLQLKPSATIQAKVLEWGFSFDGTTGGKVELIETDVAATVTAYAAADLTKLDSDALMGGDPTTNLIQVGTTSSGYTATGEGTITAVRNLDLPLTLTTATAFSKQFPMGQEPVVQINKFGRIRVTFGTAANMYCYMKIQI